MENDSVVGSLHPLEIRVLLRFGPKEEIDVDRMVQELGFNHGQFSQVTSWLSSKGLIEERRRTKTLQYELTELGATYREHGSPEERLLALVRDHGPLGIQEIAQQLNLENSDIGSAFGALTRDGIVAMDGDKKITATGRTRGERISITRILLDRAAAEGVLSESALAAEEKVTISSLSRKRGSAKGAFRTIEREDVSYLLSASGARKRQLLIDRGITGDEIGALTPELLETGEWRDKAFRRYNIQVPPIRVLLGRRNPYGEFLEQLKDKLVSLGFEEYEGPLLETEFWNCDALFMPQFHSARDIHDVFYVKEPAYAKKIDEPYLTQVAQTHENGWDTGSHGWRYHFDHNFTKRMILRSQGTVMSAKALTRAKIPGKYFGVVRCFRYDQVDATHLADFYQTEGIVLGEEVNLRTLLGLLKMFAAEVAQAKEIRFAPGYFPFTEPSVEVHIRHPKLGWFELGGSGIFRPEVTKPLGVDVPVLAWGLGIDRMALMSLGLNDLRDLFADDIEKVRLMRRRS